MLLLLRRGGVLSHVVLGCSCLSAVGVLLLRVLWLGGARLRNNQLAGVSNWVCVGSGESSGGRVGSAVVAVAVNVVVGCCVAAVGVSRSSSLLILGFFVAVTLSVSVSSFPPGNHPAPVLSGRSVRPVTGWPVPVSCSLPGFKIGFEGVLRDVGVLVELILKGSVLEVGCPSLVDHSCPGH